MSSSKGNLVRKAGWALFGKIAVSLSWILVYVLIARVLVPDEVGSFLVIISLVGLASIIGPLGLPQLVTRYTAIFHDIDKSDALKLFLTRAFGIAVVSAILWSLLFQLLLSEPFGRMLKTEALVSFSGLVIGWMFCSAILRMAAEAFRGFGDIRLASLFSGASTGGAVSGLLFAIGLFILLISSSGTTGSVLLVGVIASALSLLAAGFLLHGLLKHNEIYRRVSNGSKTSEVPSIKKLILNSTPVLITNIVTVVLLQGDIWILATVTDAETVAIYGVAAKTAFLVGGALLIVNAVLPPILANAHSSGSMKEIEDVIRGMTGIAFFIAILAFLLFAVFGEQVLSIMFGGYYSEGYLILLVLTAAQVVNAWSGPCAIAMVMSGHQRELMIVTVSCGALFVAAAIWGAQNYGAVGVATAAAMATTCRNVVAVAFVRRLLGVWTCAAFNVRSARLALLGVMEDRRVARQA